VTDDATNSVRFVGPDLPLDWEGEGGGGGGGGGGGDRHLIVYLGATNAATYDRADHPLADSDGHLVAATVLSMPGGHSSMTPVQARVAHGVSPIEAAAMLRKMADLIEASPDVCSGRPGEQARRTPFGPPERTRLTPEHVTAAVQSLPGELRRRMGPAIERLLRSIQPD